MILTTNQAGLQIYDAKHLNRSHLAIEPQGWPNAINEKTFPSQIYNSNEIYRSINQYKFVQIKL